MKKLLVTLLVAATTLNFAACGNKDKGAEGGDKNAKVSISVQVEKDWLPYYEKVKETVLKEYPNATIEFKETGSFDHIQVLNTTKEEKPDFADLFAIPANK